MTVHEILLGFEVPSGKAVYISVHHLAAFGMTQLSGKTTLLEALISRSGLRGLAFITKRGESGFTSYNSIQPFYKERVDWRYVESLVNTALGEKVKYEPGMRSAIMKVSRGPRTLRAVQELTKKNLEKTNRQFMKDVYERLIAYLDLVIPELEKREFAESLELQPGVNVMDVSDMRLEVQQLVIGSSIEYVFQKMSNVVVIIPEAWEMLPQFRMTPVKWVAEQFIRKGAAVKNYLWIDSQDIGGIDKTPLRQVSIWLMGRMMEAHEVSRLLKQTLGLKLKPKEIQTLQLGHFYATIGDEVKKVYVLPAGVPEDFGRQVAKGLFSPEQVRDKFLVSRLKEENDEVWKGKFEEEKRKREKLKKVYQESVKSVVDLRLKLEKLEKEFTRQVERISDLKVKEKSKDIQKRLSEAHKALKEVVGLPQTIQQLRDEIEQKNMAIGNWQRKCDKQLVELTAAQYVLEKLKDALIDLVLPDISAAIKATMVLEPGAPSEVTVSLEQPALTVVKERQPLTLKQADLEGRIAIVYAEEQLPDKAFSLKKLMELMERRFGSREFPGNVPKALNKFVKWGYFEKVHSGKRWDWRVKMSPKEAKAQGLLMEVEP